MPTAATVSVMNIYKIVGLAHTQITVIVIAPHRDAALGYISSPFPADTKNLKEMQSNEYNKRRRLYNINMHAIDNVMCIGYALPEQKPGIVSIDVGEL